MSGEVLRAAFGHYTEGPAEAPFGSRIGADEAAAIPGGVRSKLEQASGTDLSDVRVHTGPRAAAAANAEGARAFAKGDDITFGADEYDPISSEGRHLLAHEVGHVVQQRGGTQAVARKPTHGPSAPASLELEADMFADAFVAGQSAPALTRQPLAIARKEKGEESRPKQPSEPVEIGNLHGGQFPVSILVKNEHIEGEVEGAQVTYDAKYEVFSQTIGMEIGQPVRLKTIRTIDIVFEGGAQATLKVEGSGDIEEWRPGGDDAKAYLNSAAIRTRHSATLIFPPSSDFEVWVTLDGESLKADVESDRLLRYDAPMGFIVRELENRTEDSKVRMKPVGLTRAYAKRAKELMRQLSAFRDARLSYESPDEAVLRETKRRLGDIMEAANKLEDPRQVKSRNKLLRLHRQLMNAYVEALNARPKEKSPGAHAGDAMMVIPTVAAGVVAGAVEVGRMGRDVGLKAVDEVANVFGGDIDWEPSSAVGKAYRSGQSTWEIYWDGFIGGIAASIDEALEHAENGDYSKLMNLGGEVAVDFFVPAGALGKAKKVSKISSGGKAAPGPGLREALRVSKRAAKVRDAVKSAGKAPAWVTEQLEAVAKASGRWVGDSLGVRKRATAGGPAMSGPGDLPTFKQHLAMAKLEAVRPRVLEQLGAQGVTKKVDAEGVFNRLEEVLGSDRASINAITEVMEMAAAHGSPAYIQAVGKAVNLAKRFDDGLFAALMYRSTKVANGARFVDDVAWLARKQLSAAARNALARKIAAGSEPDLHWLRKVDLKKEDLEFMAADSKTGWGSFTKASRSSSDKYPKGIRTPGVPKANAIKDANTKARGIAAEMAARDIELPDGVKITSRQLKIEGKDVDYRAVDVDGRDVGVEVKGDKEPTWRKRLGGKIEQQRKDPGNRRMVKQLKAAATLGTRPVLVISDGVTPATLGKLRVFLERNDLAAVRIARVGEGAIQEISRRLRRSMRVPGVAKK